MDLSYLINNCKNNHGKRSIKVFSKNYVTKDQLCDLSTEDTYDRKASDISCKTYNNYYEMYRNNNSGMENISFDNNKKSYEKSALNDIIISEFNINNNNLYSNVVNNNLNNNLNKNEENMNEEKESTTASMIIDSCASTSVSLPLINTSCYSSTNNSSNSINSASSSLNLSPSINNNISIEIDLNVINKYIMSCVYSDEDYDNYVENTLTAIAYLQSFLASKYYEKEVQRIKSFCLNQIDNYTTATSASNIAYTDNNCTNKILKSSILYSSPSCNNINNTKHCNNYNFLNLDNTFNNIINLQALENKVKYTFKDTLVLDLDETLIRCDFPINPYKQYDFVIEEMEFGIHIRPNLINFLEETSKLFNLVIFSAGNNQYVETILKKANIRDYFYLVLTKSECIKVSDEIYIKDLTIIEELNKQIFLSLSNSKEIIIVDNNMLSFAKQIEQGILISSYIGNKNDDCLIDLLDFLNELYNNKYSDILSLQNNNINSIDYNIAKNNNNDKLNSTNIIAFQNNNINTDNHIINNISKQLENHFYFNALLNAISQNINTETNSNN